MLTKLLCPFFYLLIVCLSPILIWIVIFQLLLDRKICHYRKLYKENKLNNHIYARKCEIREVPNKKIVKKFLRQNHLFGIFIIIFYLCKFHKHKIIGLYYNNELVYLTCLKKKKDAWYCYAMCSGTDITVVGGASKCLKQVNESITTISFNKSTLYQTLDFEEDGHCNLLEMILGVHSKSGMLKYWRRG